MDPAEQSKVCAEKALAYFNRSASEYGDMTYEVVGNGKSSKFRGPEAENYWCFHSNFEAKPNNDNPESDTLLFFAELKVYDDNSEYYAVTVCAILGPVGRRASIGAGLAGCIGCGSVSGDSTINHPLGHEFYKGGIN